MRGREPPLDGGDVGPHDTPTREDRAQYDCHPWATDRA